VACVDACAEVCFGTTKSGLLEIGVQTQPQTSQVGGVPEKVRTALHWPHDKVSVIGVSAIHRTQSNDNIGSRERYHSKPCLEKTCDCGCHCSGVPSRAMDKTAIVLGIITVVAILVGPVAALYIQRRLDIGREARNRKMGVFKTLMSYRSTRLAPIFVQALNLIDVEFDGDNKKEKDVRDAWKELLDLLNNFKTTANAEEKSRELSANLLQAMGKCLGYDFDKVQVKKGAYYPEGLVNTEQEQHAVRRGILDVLQGKRRIPIGIFEDKFPAINIPDIPAEELLPPEAPKKLLG
jgi:hypothetical protein